MPHERLARTRRVVLRAATVLLALAVLSTIFFLPFAGRYLVSEDPLVRADAIFVLAGARAERWLEGVDLHREGWAPRIVLSHGRVEAAELKLRQLGVRYPTSEELSRSAIVQLGVPDHAVEILPDALDNTAQEASALAARAAASRWQRVIVVTSMYHTRRSRFAFARTFRGTGVQIVIRGSRYDDATPARWWTKRSDIRMVGLELPKLLLYRLGLAG